MRYHVVDCNHWVVSGGGYGKGGVLLPSGRLGLGGRRFWSRVGLGEAEGAVVVYEGGEVVGFFRYFFEGRGVMHACGTWVDVRYRRMGVAECMWNKALRKFAPKKVCVDVCNRASLRMVDKIKELNVGIKFKVGVECG